jgi:iron complex outermembrane recepter protein
MTCAMSQNENLGRIFMSSLIKLSAKALLASSCFAALATPGFARDANSNEANIEDSNVIVVTANKRSENIQKVPIAITAIGKEQLAVTGFSDVRDISGLAPNVSVSPGASNPMQTIVAIRGISAGGDEALTLDQSIAMYIDGVYIGRSAASAVFSKDVEAVEVARGPQGTLFGRNSTGGAISFRMIMD